jgi:hypothetical protein
MYKTVILRMIFCVVATLSAAAQTTNSDKLTALQTEIRQLRLELVQQHIEFQQWKIEQLETALKDARDDREQLDVEERAAHQALVDSSAAEGDETTSFRAELTETTLKKLRARQASAQQRESELQQRLTRERAVLQECAKRQQQLRAGA